MPQFSLHIGIYNQSNVFMSISNVWLCLSNTHELLLCSWIYSSNKTDVWQVFGNLFKKRLSRKTLFDKFQPKPFSDWLNYVVFIKLLGKNESVCSRSLTIHYWFDKFFSLNESLFTTIQTFYQSFKKTWIM